MAASMMDIHSALPSTVAGDDSDAAIARAVLAHLRAAGLRSALGSDHDHVLAPRDAWPWLPTQEHRHLAIHPYCAACGGVKYVGSTRALPLGGLANLAAHLRATLGRQGRKVTEAQMRLIMKRLQRAEASDTFTQGRATQERLLLQAFAAYTSLDETTLATYLHSS